MGENVMSWGRLNSGVFGGEGVASVSRSNEKTLSEASTDCTGSISQPLSTPDTVSPERRHSGVFVLRWMKEPPSHTCWLWARGGVASVSSEGMRKSSSSPLFISTASSSRLSKLSQLDISGSVSWSRVNCTALLPVPLGLSKVSHNRLVLNEAPCWQTGGLRERLWVSELVETSGGSREEASSRVTLSLQLAERRSFSARSSSTAFRHEVFTSMTCWGNKSKTFEFLTEEKDTSHHMHRDEKGK